MSALDTLLRRPGWDTRITLEVTAEGDRQEIVCTRRSDGVYVRARSKQAQPRPEARFVCDVAQLAMVELMAGTLTSEIDEREQREAVAC